MGRAPTPKSGHCVMIDSEPPDKMESDTVCLLFRPGTPSMPSQPIFLSLTAVDEVNGCSSVKETAARRVGAMQREVLRHKEKLAVIPR
ncbi:hypothetical protein BDW72DRAFT_187674 [Aspergillus terricola var. indicus]